QRAEAGIVGVGIRDRVRREHVVELRCDHGLPSSRVCACLRPTAATAGLIPASVCPFRQANAGSRRLRWLPKGGKSLTGVTRDAANPCRGAARHPQPVGLQDSQEAASSALYHCSLTSWTRPLLKPIRPSPLRSAATSTSCPSRGTSSSRWSEALA